MDMRGEHRFSWIVSFILIMTILPVGAETLPDQGRGRVNMQGTIVDTACAIAVDSRDQTIDMEVVPLSDIIRDGQGRSKPFTIHLENCVLERSDDQSARRQFQVTFDGNAEGNLFGVQGDASGIALKIFDSVGNQAIPGSPLPFGNIAVGDMQLNYTLKIVANNNTLKAGGYFSIICFKLDYF